MPRPTDSLVPLNFSTSSLGQYTALSAHYVLKAFVRCFSAETERRWDPGHLGLEELDTEAIIVRELSCEKAISRILLAHVWQTECTDSHR